MGYSENPMRVLTVRQPWAHAIAHLGKTVENRPWSTKYRGPLAIHAGRTYDLDARPRVEMLAGRQVPFPLVGGVVVAVAELVDVHSADDCYEAIETWGRVAVGGHHCSPWGEPGAFHFVLDDVRPLKDAYGLQGMLGLRRLPVDHEREILARVA